ncbi:DUF1573 domain-containing protein [Gabonibacter massiliensis]|uniref:DUF1573 domain-containing protein n=1 Tax=Gabonibacter massiliensis TaxID=1720195 RepID=UPI00073F7849|nr:DUF1573 domain-containing protein [Gabonibacter massiliensis]
MRNFVFVLVVIFAGLTACSSGKRPACVSPVGKLCFSTDKLELGDIYWNEEYRDTIIVRNPTEKTIRLGGWGYTAGVQCRMSGGTLQEWQSGDAEIAARGQDTLLVVVQMTKDSQLGYFFTFLRFSIDGVLVDPNQGVSLEANVIEHFDTVSTGKLSLPKIVADKKEVDFDTIVQGEKVEAAFVLRNEGDKDLIIRKIETTCGCTAAVPEKRIISPGENVRMNVVFDSEGRRGMQHKTITVICNDPRHASLKLVLKGYVK